MYFFLNFLWVYLQLYILYLNLVLALPTYGKRYWHCLHSDKWMAWLELQSSGPFIILKVSLVFLFSKYKVSFNDLHTSQQLFFPSHGLDVSSASTLSKTVQARGFLRLLPFLKPIIGTFVKTALWATSGVRKRCNSAKKILTF